ncbi:hypothetical protein [Chitinophaga ginsengisoli]|uniref:Uncharacterized protein n=1 Tax=Chitinophaga ginsengisoli TaxID=363837 RepID=A0A2P8FVT4_9BACT|nr:hypothetical protein [Chitinophaga ginsengisoli]PSL25831.1 hypothetical protein CLV42_11236 [Chitinophaga ginsengisoli]
MKEVTHYPSIRLRLLKLSAYAVLLFIAPSLYAQKKPLPPPHIYVEGCIKKTRLSFASRIKHYPFNLSSQIQLISFNGLVKITDNGEFSFSPGEEQIIDGGLFSGDPDTIQTVPVGMREIRTMTLAQIDTLTDILYNYGHGGNIWIESVSGCYIPRNAILFRDNNGKVIAFIEICFRCGNTRQSSEDISLGEPCDRKLDMLKALFKQAGITYGIDK